MLSELFYWVLNISILGGVTGLIILLLRKIKWLPRFAVYLLWMIPLIRLWVPFGMGSEYSLFNLVSKYATKTVVVWEKSPVLPEISGANSIQAAATYFPITYKTDLLKDVFHVASLVWILLAGAALLAACLLYFLTKSELASAERIRDNLYKSDKITCPAVYGIFHPKIILPAAIADGDTAYILLHEQVHVRRKDNLLRVIAIVTACVHWFNPLVWILLKCFLADMELACDAKVIRNMDETKKTEYASSVLAASTGKAFFASAFGGAKTRVRIENILSYKKLTLFSMLCFTALVAVVAFVLMTNATG